MLKFLLIAICGVVFASALAVGPASALVPVQSFGSLHDGLPNQGRLGEDPINTSVTATEATRLSRTRLRRGVSASQPSAQAILTAAQSHANAAHLDCRVTQADLRGYNSDLQGVYEVACGNGKGYVIGASSPPQATDCITIAGRADIARAENPGGPPPLECRLESNANVTRTLAGYAREAGVSCAVDQAGMVGTSVAGNAVYEVGCPGSEGFWVERTSAGWTATPCIKVAATGSTCRFTTSMESAVSAKAWLANSPASACDIVDVRYMGANAAGAFYETRCGEGDGYVARLDSAMAVQQVYPCAQAASIGGGCKLAAQATANRQ